MAIGGIPYYLNYFRAGFSLAQNIDRLFFAQNTPLREEFNRLFASLFGNPDDSKAIVKLLASRRYGYSRKEISEKLNKTSRGTLTQTLTALTASDFITSFIPLDKKKERYYKLTDNFCLFYLNFIEKKGTNDESFWQHSALSPAIASWQGFAFEEVCFAHTLQIKAALGIAGIQTNISSLIITKDEDQSGMQIDMLIDRADRVINLCEIKYCNQEYVIDKHYEEKLRQRVERIRELTKNRRNIHLTLITTFGLHYNEYSGRIQKTINMDDLFA